MLTILVNRREPTGRRNFDLAHELFHLLTWDSMPPDRVEPTEVPGMKGNRVERLAENCVARVHGSVEACRMEVRVRQLAPPSAFFSAELLENSVEQPSEFLASDEIGVVTGFERSANRPSAQDLLDLRVVPQRLYGS